MLFYTEPRSARRFTLSLEGHPCLPRASRGRRRNSFAQRLSSPSYPRKSAVSVLPFILPSACPPGRAFCLFRLSPSRCAVEDPMKDASHACPVPDGEGVSRPKDHNVHVSLLECAVTKKGGGVGPSYFSFFTFPFSYLLLLAGVRRVGVDDADAMIDEGRVHAGNSTRGMWAGDAILGRSAARSTRMVRRGFLRARRCVSGQALRVKLGGIVIGASIVMVRRMKLRWYSRYLSPGTQKI